MTDNLILLALNAVLQVTFLSGCGIALAMLFRRRAAVRYWILFSTLLLILLAPLTSTVMQHQQRGLILVRLQSAEQKQEPIRSLERSGGDLQDRFSSTEFAELARDERDAGDGANVVGAGEAIASGSPLNRVDSPLSDELQRQEHMPSMTEASGALQADAESRAPRPSSRLSSWRYVAEILIGIWVVGAVVMLVRLCISFWRLARLMSAAVPCNDPALEAMVARICSDLGIAKIPRLVISHQVSGPVTAGILRPQIVLPVGLATQVSEDSLKEILVHELAHVLRRDQCTVLLQHVVGAIYWFHPLAIWLNRALAKAREEVCDNYVLATSNATAYSRSLLTLGETLAAPTVPAVGLFTPRWKLEERIAGLLDERRNRSVNLRRPTRLVVMLLLIVMATGSALSTISLASGQDGVETTTSEQRDSSETAPELSDDSQAPNDSKDPRDPQDTKADLLRGPTIRGEGESQEMLVRGRVVDVNGRPASGFEFDARAYEGRLGRKLLPVEVTAEEFAVWVPIGGSRWFYLELTATAVDERSRAFKGIATFELREAAIEGVVLQLAPTGRSVEIFVTHHGDPVANANVNAELMGNLLLQKRTDARGRAQLFLGKQEKLRQLTAWTDDFRIGGFSFNRKPRRDPMGDSFIIELEDCHDQTIRFLDEQGEPVSDVAFEITVGTGPPNYNFVANRSTLPHSRLKTDHTGEAIFRWFPNWETHGAYVEIVDSAWATVLRKTDWHPTEDDALAMLVKRRVSRKPLRGKVVSDRSNVGGLPIEVHSFQGEEEGTIDKLYTFTDDSGHFSIDCIPGATYSLCVNDRNLQSEMIDLIPFEPEIGRSNTAVLEVMPGNPVEVHVTSGPRREPMRNQFVYVRQQHSYTWMEDGREKSGSSARDQIIPIDDAGMARVRALPGSELRFTVNAGEWRSEAHHVTVAAEGTTTVEIHRQISQERTVEGRLVAPRDLDVELSGAQLVYGSIDGQTDEREETVAGEKGVFALTTRAIDLGIFAYTSDGKASGAIKPENLNEAIELKLQPTMDMRGRLLGSNDEPLAHHAVRVMPRVSGKKNFNTSFATSFRAMTFETKTDAEGNYVLKDLPTEFDMTLWADPVDDSKYDQRVEGFFLVPGEERPRMVSRLGRASRPDIRTLAEKHNDVLRSAKLDGYGVLVLSYDSESGDYVNSQILNYSSNRQVASLLNLRIDQDALSTRQDREFAASKNWPAPAPATVFLCALDASGTELGRTEIEVSDASSAASAAEFIRQHAPPQTDAKAKWDEAFAEANRSGRRVWARIGQRYCGPCFRLSNWLDDNRELLARDYVFFKIDNVRDTHGEEIGSRIVDGRENFGVPFHTIYDAEGRRLIDSESPVGNIGHPSSFEGIRHLAKMLNETRKNLTEADVAQIVDTLER